MNKEIKDKIIELISGVGEIRADDYTDLERRADQILELFQEYAKEIVERAKPKEIEGSLEYKVLDQVDSESPIERKIKMKTDFDLGYNQSLQDYHSNLLKEL